MWKQRSYNCVLSWNDEIWGLPKIVLLSFIASGLTLLKNFFIIAHDNLFQPHHVSETFGRVPLGDRRTWSVKARVIQFVRTIEKPCRRGAKIRHQELNRTRSLSHLLNSTKKMQWLIYLKNIAFLTDSWTTTSAKITVRACTTGWNIATQFSDTFGSNTDKRFKKHLRISSAIEH